MISEKYDPSTIELAAQRHWEAVKAFVAKEDSTKPKFYCLSMFPYPSGKLHMGHVRNYTIGDALSRFMRMQGYNVLQPMGWDAFGMPAENAAMQHGVRPAEWTYNNINDMRIQLQRLGFSIDWSREIATCHPDYYRWEQWLFTRLFKNGLIYKKKGAVNWDPIDQTVLANEQVIDGKGWRSGAVVEKREIPMYYFKITQYAEALLADLELLKEWPDQVLTMQRNWIGYSQGYEISFKYDEKTIGGCGELLVFTTRADTLMGVTYLAVAPEHPLALKAAECDQSIAEFLVSCRQGSATEAEYATQEKLGIATPFYVQHPITQQNLPIWIANYVLMSYGEGAVMAVPAHDERDFEFAKKYNLPITAVVADNADNKEPVLPFTSYGILINSYEYTGLSSEQAIERISQTLISKNQCKPRRQFRLRDWGISRQRYWGCPIPIIHCETCGDVPIPDDQLPVKLPEEVSMTGEGSPLTRMPEWYTTTCPVCGQAAVRETDTMDTFVESSWYFMRYCCRDNKNSMLDDRVLYWLNSSDGHWGVDQYIGGIEHAILHLLYARFWTKLIDELKILPSLNLKEPFRALLTQGMVVSETFYRTDSNGKLLWLNANDITIEKNAKGQVLSAKTKVGGHDVMLGGIQKMSKSKNNGVDPQAIIEQYGADTARLFILFASPPEQSLEWSDHAVEGAHRFLRRLWRIVYEHVLKGVSSVNWFGITLSEKQHSIRRQLHRTISKVTDDYARRKQFNTAIAAVMELLNTLQRFEAITPVDRMLMQEALETILLMLSPIVPHITHHLWESLCPNAEAIDRQVWPCCDEKALVDDKLSLVVQVNGKLRGQISLNADASSADIEHAALSHDSVRVFIDGKPIKKLIVVPGKLVNVVI